MWAAKNRNQVHVFAIHVDGHWTFVRYDGQRGSGSRHAGCTVGSGGWMSQSKAKLIAREDGGAHFCEILVAAGVVAMHVSIHHEADRFVRNLVDGRGNLL